MEYLHLDSKYIEVYGCKLDIKEYMKYGIYETYFLSRDSTPEHRYSIHYIGPIIYKWNGTSISGRIINTHISNCKNVLLPDGQSFYIYMEE